ncbi:MAG TPA: site-2 protease family protein [Noviherbaspirillum sp.]|nr:site-2 protease family protein [Noviherbaspirillum sp.]
MKALALLFGLLKSSKVLTTSGSMLVSLWIYAVAFGWKFAAGFIALLFAHEMGHYVAARQRGLDVGAPTFIPFVGAWIEMKQMPHDAETEAYVGFGGPFIGTLAALACYGAARATDSPIVLAIAYAGFMLNLFNLIPVSPLDGGRITAVLSPRVWLFGIPVLLAWFFWRPSPMLIIVALLALPQLAKAVKYRADTPDASYYQVSAENKLTYAIYYLGLTGFCAMMSFELHNILARPG